MTVTFAARSILLAGVVGAALSVAVLVALFCLGWVAEARRRAYSASRGHADLMSWAPWGEDARWPDVPADRRPFDWARD